MNFALAWLLTLGVHATLLLTLAWCVDLARPALSAPSRELLWRTALFGALLTATLQLTLPPSFTGAWRWTPEFVAPAAPHERIERSALTISVDAAASDRAARRDAAPGAIAEAPVTAARSVAAAPAAHAGAAAAFLHSIDWRHGVAAGWLAGALLMLARLFRAWASLRRTLRRAVALSHCDALADAAELAARAGMAAPPTLHALDDLPSPIALRRAIVLPQWALRALDRDQLRAMLAHELGHVVRRDSLWKLLIAAWRAVLWFVPLAGVAQRRLDEAAELACDAFAAQHTGDGRRLAECLAQCAEHHVRGFAFELAPAMSARPSSLIRRVERLLEGDYGDGAGSRALPRAVAALALAVAVVALPGVGLHAAHAAAPPVPAPPAAPAPPSPPSPPAKPQHLSISEHGDDNGRDTMTVSFSDDGHKFRATVEGKIAFNDEETDIVSLGGGSATLEETRDGVTRRLELHDRNGMLERRYFVAGNERPLDEAGRAFVTDLVKQLVRSGIGAGERAKRLYAKGGAKLVLDEVGQIPSDYVRGIYIRELVGLGKLAPGEVDRAVKLAGAMKTDYERRQALAAIFDKQVLDASEQVTFLQQALRFDTDYERAELLIGVLPKLADTTAVRQAWLDAGLKVKSDYERRRTLQAMLSHGGLDDAQVASIIEASSSMGSDYEHRELLVAAAQRAHDRDAIAPAYVRSAQKIGSDYEHREALLALIHGGKLGTAGASAVLDSAAQIGSGYECREVLVALARVMPDDAALQARYREVARKLPEYERTQAENALVR